VLDARDVVDLDRFGRIDGLINNAAVFQRRRCPACRSRQIPVAEWDRLMAVNR
jgi:NAD(P)-dependent dehydrogenase (short-subunit alcohol dehydrogenase family)